MISIYSDGLRRRNRVFTDAQDKCSNTRYTPHGKCESLADLSFPQKQNQDVKQT